MFRLPRCFVLVCRWAFCGLSAATAWSGPLLGQPGIPGEILFNRDVRPIMSNTCFKCHGSDVKANEADLRLDLPSEAFRKRVGENGKEITPIVPGKPGLSEAWRRISTDDEADVMPPVDNLHQLTERDKAVFKRWIEQGAEYQDHWAYITPVRGTVPEVRDSARLRNEVDAFIQAKLESEGIEPSPEADRATLIRRLSLDLVGLPPTPRDVDQFVNDTREDAYERLVDRLLSSRHYGERMAVPWLDVVRFADSVGFHGDQRLNIFPYRDYVIDAFNKNKPYDEFITEQIAGDLLPDPSVEQRVATGFNRLNMVTREGGAQSKEYLAKYAADRVRAVSTAFLGSTMACAECHDHKFDPFSTKDFYSMAAFFADVKQYGVYNDYKYTPEPELAGWNNDFPFPPEIEVRNDYLTKRQAQLEKVFRNQVRDHAQSILSEGRNKVFESWVRKVSGFVSANPTGWDKLRPGSIVSSAETRITVKDDQSVLFEDSASGSTDKKEEIVLKFTPAPGPLATLRLELLPDPVHGGNIFRDEDVQTHVGMKSTIPRVTMEVRWAVRRPGMEESEALTISSAYANLKTENYFNGFLLTAFEEEFKSSRDHSRDAHQIHYLLKSPIDWQEGDELVVILKSDNVGRVRVSASPIGLVRPGEPVETRVINALAAGQPDAGQRQLQAEQFVMSRRWHGSVYPELLQQFRKIAECRDGRAFTAITQSTDPLITRVLGRGDWKDDTGEIVSPSPPAFLLEGVPGIEAQRASRLDLAHWITHPDNPLTSRTMVNRLWALFFGTGLSAVLDDLGNQGEWPSHPGLLDWLAVEFVESGWDVKALVRHIVSSATYRQSSRHRPELRDKDPNNRLLARQNPRRLEAEFVRDNALFISGLLNREVGGPSARPYQPPRYYAALNFPMREYQSDFDERQYRRGVYMHWQRTFLHPMLANFDAPGREECMAQRTVSNTPQQALTLLNDHSFVEAARVFAQRILQTPLADNQVEARLKQMYRLALARAPTSRERDSLSAFFKARLDYYHGDPGEAEAFTAIGLSPVPESLDRVELAAWSAVARVILNLNEAIVRY